MMRPRRALDACAAWVAEPSAEREAAWEAIRCGHALQAQHVERSPSLAPLRDPGEGTFRDGLPTWVVMPAWDTWRPSESVTAAARIIREARVREVAARAVLEVL